MDTEYDAKVKQLLKEGKAYMVWHPSLLTADEHILKMLPGGVLVVEKKE